MAPLYVLKGDKTISRSHDICLMNSDILSKNCLQYHKCHYLIINHQDWKILQKWIRSVPRLEIIWLISRLFYLHHETMLRWYGFIYHRLLTLNVSLILLLAYEASRFTFGHIELIMWWGSILLSPKLNRPRLLIILLRYPTKNPAQVLWIIRIHFFSAHCFPFFRNQR